MISRNLVVEDLEFAKSSLKNISYYTLINGYKDTFISADKDSFNNDLTFNDLYTLHNMDKRLANILFGYILSVEKSFKTILAYRIAEKYGVVEKDYFDIRHNSQKKGYLNSEHYSNRRNNRSKAINLAFEIIANKDADATITHYTTNHGYVPPWILFNCMTLGKAKFFYTILKPDDKEYISSTFFDKHNISTDDMKNILLDSITLLHKYRNYIAHGQRTFNCNISKQLPACILNIIDSQALSLQEYNNNLGKKDILAVFIALATLMNDKYVFNSFIAEISRFFNDYSSTPIGNKTIYEILNIPENIIHRLKLLTPKA